jgi:hypothetical protein
VQPNSSAGFILIYVAAMLVVIAVILFQLGRMRTPSPLFVERQIAQALQRREEQLMLDFVADGLRELNLAADPRYLQFKQVLASNARMPSEMEEQLAWLQAALAQLNFKIDMNRAEGAAAGAGKGQQPAPHEGKGILFQPRKDPYKLKIGEIEYVVRISPANALPNLNAIPYDMLWRYLAYLKVPEGEARDLAAALVDWRDEDDLSTDARGAESDYYRGLSLSYPARNAPIRTWQELNYVRGMSPERVVLLRDNFMLGSPDVFGVSPDFASPEAFVGLTGLSPETIRAILGEYGKLEDNEPQNRSILMSADAAAFDRVVSWRMDASTLRIQITSPESVLTAEYDTARKRVTAWWQR